MKRRILALLLTVLMLVSAFPLTLLTVFAEELGTETALEEGEVVTLYENDFSDSTKTADSKGSAASIADGVLTFGNWGDNHWTKNITLNNSTGVITISFKMQPNLQKAYDLLSVNGVVVLSAAASAIKIGNSSQAATIGYNTADIVRAVTVTVDPATGDATVSYSHPSNSSHADNFSGTVNVGTISGSLALTLGAVANGNGWTADDLLVTQQTVAAHTCNYVKSDALSSAATCTVPEMYVEECTICGATSSPTVVSPALGHDWTEYTVEDGYQTRSCNTCGHSETKKVGKIINTMPLLALGDSITFGTGVNNNPQNSWAKYVADELGLDYVNIARAGSPLYSWYCVLTGNNAPNGQMYYIGGWDQESLTREIEEASIIVFTLYTNDIFYGEWRPAEDIVECLVDFVGAIHEINPNAIIVPVGYAYGEAFWPGNQYAEYEEKLTTINELCIEAFNTGDYNDYVYYVDCTDIFSDHASFIRDYNSDPDGVHPGTQGNIAMAASVMAALGNTATGDPDTLYDITFKDGEEVVLEDSYYGMYLLPEALTKDGKVFGGWSDGTSIFVENTEVLVIGDTTFTAVWYDTAESSFNISEIMDTVEGAFVSGALKDSQVYDANTGILTAAREGRYSFSLQKDVVYDGKTTLALRSTNTYTVVGSSNTDGIGVTLPTESPVLVKNGRYVALTYYYAPVSATTNVGRPMDLYVTTSSTTFSARSVNTTVANGWATIYFDLATGANVADMAEETITSIAIRWYDGTFVSTTNDAYYFESISFTNASPFNTVKYQENGVDVAESVKVLDEVTLPETFKQNGYKVVGWKVGETTYEPGETVAITGDTTFAPVWQEINYYNVTFKDGEQTLDISGSYEEIFALPTITKDGYRFDGWSDGTTTYAAGTTVTLTADATYTAVWTKIYNVTVTNDGAVVETKTVTGSYTLPAAPTKDGYTFIGWANGTERYPAATTLTIIDDTDFVAVWIVPEENNYTNLQNTLYKLEQDKELTVGWITDSIGWGQNGNSSGIVNGVNYASAFAGGTKNPMSFTRVVTDWLEWYAKENYEIDSANIDVFYSTYGGATFQRELGYLRDDLLAYCPDVIFIETWNGTNVDSDSVYNNRIASQIYLESIVQQIYAINPYCDIVLVNPGGTGAGYAFSQIRDKYNLIEIKVAEITSAYFANTDIFGNETANATIYYGGGIHINEEAYAFYSQLITAALEEQFAAVKMSALYNTYTPAQTEDMRIVTDGEGNVTLPTNTLYGTGSLYLTSGRVDADELTYDGNWTLTDGEIDVTAPLDSAEKTGAKKITATAEGATVTFTVKGSGFVINGSGTYTVSIDGVEKGTYSGETVYIRCTPDDADGTYAITITAANGASISDVYVYAHAYTPIETYENVKERYVVTYYARIADEYIHNQQKNGYDILPKYLTWINLQRDELFGTDASATVPGGSILANKIEKNGTFVGWVEADSYSYIEGEKFPVINAYKYENGKIIDLTTDEEKTLYLESDVITPARDMTLVAVYSGGYDGDETKHVVNFISDGETLKTVNTTAQITMIAAPTKSGYIFRGWSDGQGNTFAVGNIVRVAGDTNFTAQWEAITPDADGTVRLNISDDILFSTQGALGSSATYDSENDTTTYSNGTRYTYTLFRDQAKDGVNTIKLANDSYSFTGYEGAKITLPGISVQIQDTPYISLAYFYEMTAGKNSQVGAYMTLGIKTSGGSTFYVNSDEPIVSGEWHTLIFSLDDAYVYNKAAYDVSANADETISEIYIYWYDFNGREGGFKDFAGNTYSFSTIAFSSVNPFYTASFESDGAQAHDPIDTKGSIVLPEALTKVGYNFIGWTSDDGETVHKAGDTVFVSADTTFVAVWEEYKMTFVDGTTPIDTIYSTGTFTAPECTISKLNNTFVGWTNDGGTTVYAAGDEITVTGDTTFTAVWEGNFTATFVDGVNTVKTLEKTTTFFIPEFEDLTKSGYVLIGWTAYGDDTVYTAGQEITLVGDTTFTAVWEEKETAISINYSEKLGSAETVIHDYYRGSAVTYDSETDTATISRASQYEIQAKSNVLKDGKNTIEVKSLMAAAGGWNGPALTLIYDTGLTLGEAQKVTVQYYYSGTKLVGNTMTLYLKVGDAFVYAVSAETIVSGTWATVTFDMSTHGSFETYKDTIVTEADLYFYTTQNKEATKAYSTSYQFPANDTFNFGTFFYSESETIESIGATFYDEAQENVISELTNAAGVFTIPDCDVAKDGYVFAGWKAVGDDSEKVYLVGDAISIDKNTSFVAVYKEAVNYTATFTTPDETIDPIITQTGLVVLPTPADRGGKYKFLGWSDGENTYEAGQTVEIVADTEFEAVWQIIEYTVTFMNGDTVVKTLTATVEDTITVPAAYAKEGYVFKGYSDGTTTYAAGSTVMIVGDTTFEAKYITFEENTSEKVSISEAMTTTNGMLSGFGVYEYDETNDVYTGTVTNRYIYTLSRNVAFDGKTALVLENTSYSVTGWQNSVILLPDLEKTAGEAKNISIDYYYAPISNFNNVGRYMVLRLTANNQTYYVYSEEAIVRDTWATVTFNCANAKQNKNSFDISTIESYDITKAELFWYDTNTAEGASGGFYANAGDKLYFTDISFANNTSVSDYKVTFMNGEEKYAEVETNGTIVLPELENCFGWNDGTTTYAPGATVTITADTTLNAVLSETYTVTVLDGETEIATGSTTGEYKLPEALEKDGYNFIGWSDETSTFAAGSTVTVTADTTFVAVWEKINYINVSFYDGETLISELTDVLDTVTIPAALTPEKDYLLFMGWSDGEEIYEAGETVTVIEDTVFTAVWKEKAVLHETPEKTWWTSDTHVAELLNTTDTVIIEFGIQIASTGASKILQINGKDVITMDDSRNAFVGDEEESGITFDQWSMSTVTVTITDLQTGEATVYIYSKGATYTTTITLGEIGSTITLTGDSKSNNSSDKISQIVDVRERYNVTYTDGETEYDSATVIDSVVLPSYELADENKVIVGWTDGTNTYAVGDTVQITADTIFTAIIKTVYNATFTGDGVEESTQKTDTDGKVTMIAAPEREGYAFLGWSDGTTTYDAGDTVTLAADTTFTAVWQELVYVDVSFYDGDTLISGPTSVLGTVTMPEALTADNDYAIFMGWSDGEKTYAAGETVTVIEDTVFTAVWKEKAVLHETPEKAWWTSDTHVAELLNTTDTVIIEFGIQIANTGASKILQINGKDVITMDDSRNAFVGDEEESVITFDQWSMSTVTVTITDLQTGEATVYIYSKGATYTTTITLGEIGSTITLTGDSKSNNSSDKVSQLIDLRPRYNVTVNDENGQQISSEISFGEFTLPAAPDSKDGYVFTGWNDGTSTFAAGSTVTVTADTTFAPVWKKIDSNITFGHSVTFENNLSLNYYIPEAQLSGYDSFYLVVKKGDELVTITDHDLTVNGYKFVFEGISACEAGVELEATLHADLDGESYASNSDTYSVKEYAYNKLAESTEPAFKTLLVDMLNYCAAAQLYFGVDTENLVNAELTNEQKALATQTDADVSGATGTNDTTGIIWGKSVVFNSNVELKFYMDLSAYDDITLVTVKLEYTANGVATVKTVDYNDFAYNSQYDAYTVKMVDIAAADLRDEVKVTVLYDGEEVSDTVSYNVAAYVNSRLTNSTNESFKTLLKELMKYSDSAKTYFNK